MQTKTIAILGTLGGLLILGFILVISLVGTFNSYTSLEVNAKNLITDNKNVLDNTRKSIREAGAISDKEVEALVGIISGYAEKRGQNTAGSGANVTVGMVKEAVPSVTEIKTLNRLMNIVVAGRKDWQAAQTRLIAVKTEGDRMIQQIPGNIILPLLGKRPIDIIIVTSTETESNFATGKDDSQWIESKPKPVEK